MAREKDIDELVEEKPKNAVDPIEDLINRGYQSGTERRKPHSRKHAEFLYRGGVRA